MLFWCGVRWGRGGGGGGGGGGKRLFDVFLLGGWGERKEEGTGGAGAYGFQGLYGLGFRD